VNSVPWAYTENYQARFVQESTSDSEITVITPDDLVKFYQAYMIAKDTQYRQPVTRTLSVELSIVELSTAFLTVCLLVALLLAAGIAKYMFFMGKHRPTMVVTRESKLDWMLQSIKEAAASSPIVDRDSFRRSGKTHSSTMSEDLSALPKAGGLMRAEFEAAMYGALDQASRLQGQKRVMRGVAEIGHVAMPVGTGDQMPWMQKR
jgi:hypothetical protein